MVIGGGGAGVLLALAAVLWMAYLVPTWFKRREYLATERNAIRLQQTLRILAESAEVPHTVHVEATARSVAEQQRALRMEAQRAAAALRSKDAQAARASAARMAVSQPELAHHLSAASALPRRVRRTRGMLAVGLIVSLVVLVVQGVSMLVAGPAPGAWLGLGCAGFIGLSSVVLLGRLADVNRQRARRARLGAGGRVADAVPRVSTPIQDLQFEPTPRTWTPVQLPKPRVNPRASAPRPVMADPREDQRIAEGEAQHRVVRLDQIAAAVEKAAAEAREAEAREVAEREARAAAAMTADGSTASGSSTSGDAEADAGAGAAVGAEAPRAPLSRFAAMGRIDLGEQRAPDLDQALRRRRAI